MSRGTFRSFWQRQDQSTAKTILKRKPTQVNKARAAFAKVVESAKRKVPTPSEPSSASEGSRPDAAEQRVPTSSTASEQTSSPSLSPSNLSYLATWLQSPNGSSLAAFHRREMEAASNMLALSPANYNMSPSMQRFTPPRPGPFDSPLPTRTPYLLSDALSTPPPPTPRSEFPIWDLIVNPSPPATTRTRFCGRRLFGYGVLGVSSGPGDMEPNQTVDREE